jgi:hypothetical protein
VSVLGRQQPDEGYETGQADQDCHKDILHLS